MAKRFKLRFSRVITSFQLCRSKKSANLPQSPISVIHRLSPVNPKAFDIGFPNFPAPPPSTPEDSFIKPHLSPKIASVGCGCRARSCAQYLSPDASFESSDYSWKKEATRLQVVAKAQNSKLRKNYEAASVSGYESNGEIAVVSVSKYDVKKEKRKEKVKAMASVSSRDSGCFSSEEADNEETETLISTSRSFSDDSSFELENKNNKKKGNGAIMKMKGLRSFGSKKHRGVSRTKTTSSLGALSSENDEIPGGDSALPRMTPHTAVAAAAEAEGKVSESVAVVKESEDPYEDFKRSMLEMILEKQMFEAKDLEQLLQCFLSLNSRQYHGVIVEAFTEIWEALFCDYSMNGL